jgi:hypothetical protein
MFPDTEYAKRATCIAVNLARIVESSQDWSLPPFAPGNPRKGSNPISPSAVIYIALPCELA